MAWSVKIPETYQGYWLALKSQPALSQEWRGSGAGMKGMDQVSFPREDPLA